MKDYLRRNRIQLVTILVVSILSVTRILQEEKPYATGDAVEYSLMTEAFFNHLSPNVEVSDCESFKAAYEKVNGWEENDKALAYDETQEFIANDTYKKLDYSHAFFVDKDGKKYSAHFFFYSLLNVPVRWLCALFPFNPLLVFYITNTLLIISCSFLFFTYSRFEKLPTAAFVLLFFYSTNYWYFCWVHPEVFTVCFISLGLWLFFYGKQYAGMLLVSIAALQNQPIAVLLMLLVIITLFKKGVSYKNIFYTGLSSCWVLMPAVYYYYHFGTTNLINYQGALSTDYITFTRVSGFFFDLNQGMILALPFILIAYLFLIIRKLILIRHFEMKWDLLIPVSVLLMVASASTINNWNHGQAVVNRYVTYIGAVILVHFFILVMQVEKKVWRNSFLIISIITQFITVIYFQSMNKFDWSTYDPKPLSNWVLKNYPYLYNPDPTIFISRYAPEMLEKVETSPGFYITKDGKITKLLVHRDYLNNLRDFGISQTQIDSLAPGLKYINDWAYVDISAKFTPVPSYKTRVSMEIEVIKSNSTWYEAIKKKAIADGITEAEALRRDAVYTLDLEIMKNGSRTEKIQSQINQIMCDPAWLKLIEEKAKAQQLPLDTVVMHDAIWTIDQLPKK